MIINPRPSSEDEPAAHLAGQDDRTLMLRAAGEAMARILEEVGDDCAVVLLNACISAVEDRMRAVRPR